jgi:hypothetical protein
MICFHSNIPNPLLSLSAHKWVYFKIGIDLNKWFLALGGVGE